MPLVLKCELVKECIVVEGEVLNTETPRLTYVEEDGVQDKAEQDK
jgi:hypothetical protein